LKIYLKKEIPARMRLRNRCAVQLSQKVGVLEESS